MQEPWTLRVLDETVNGVRHIGVRVEREDGSTYAQVIEEAPPGVTKESLWRRYEALGQQLYEEV